MDKGSIGDLAGERQIADSSRRFHAGKGLQVFHQRLEKLRARGRLRIAGLGKRDLEREYVVRPKSGADRGQAGEAFDQETGSAQQDEGKRQLRNHEHS